MGVRVELQRVSIARVSISVSSLSVDLFMVLRHLKVFRTSWVSVTMWSLLHSRWSLNLCVGLLRFLAGSWVAKDEVMSRWSLVLRERETLGLFPLLLAEGAPISLTVMVL